MLGAFLAEGALTANSVSVRLYFPKSLSKVAFVAFAITLPVPKAMLSEIDIEILALALEYKEENKYNPIILTDDYSIQNMSNFLKIEYKNISQKGITKRFKWISRCQGCGKKFKEDIKICPICGSEIKKKVNRRENLE